MLKKSIVVLILFFPIFVFSEYREGLDGDWLRVKSKTNQSPLSKDSVTDNVQKLLNITNISFTSLNISMADVKPLFGGGYDTSIISANLFHINSKGRFYQFSLSYDFAFDFQILSDSFHDYYLDYDIFSGFEVAFMYGVPLIHKLGRYSISLVSLDMGGMLSYYYSSNSTLNGIFFVEPRFGVRVTRCSTDGWIFSHTFFSAYLHAALQYHNFNGYVVDPDSHLRLNFLEDENYKPALVIGGSMQIYSCHINIEIDLLARESSSRHSWFSQHINGYRFGIGVVW